MFLKTAIVLLIHGGGFLIGAPSNLNQQVQTLRSEGIHAYSVYYRMDSAQHELGDVTRAVNNAKRHYRHVYVVGWSAGGTLALRIAQNTKVDAVASVEPVIDVMDWAAGNIYLDSIMGNDGRALLDPRMHRCPTLPTMVVHGDADTVAPYSDSVSFAQHCKLKFRTRHNVGHAINYAYWHKWFDSLIRKDK